MKNLVEGTWIDWTYIYTNEFEHLAMISDTSKINKYMKKHLKK